MATTRGGMMFCIHIAFNHPNTLKQVKKKKKKK